MEEKSKRQPKKGKKKVKGIFSFEIKFSDVPVSKKSPVLTAAFTNIFQHWLLKNLLINHSHFTSESIGRLQ